MNRGRAPCISRRGEGKDLRVFLFLRNDKRNKLVASFTLVCRPRDSLQSFLRFSVSFLLPFSFFLFTTVSLPSPGNFPASFPPPISISSCFVSHHPTEIELSSKENVLFLAAFVMVGWNRTSCVHEKEENRDRCARLVWDPSIPAQWSAITFPRWIFVQLKTGSDSTYSSISRFELAHAQIGLPPSEINPIAEIKYSKSSLESNTLYPITSTLCNYEILCKSDVNSSKWNFDKHVYINGKQ